MYIGSGTYLGIFMLDNNEVNSQPLAEQKETQLRCLLREHTPMLIAYSGGVDSAYLAYIAYQELKENMFAVLSISPSLSNSEKDRALLFLQHHAIPHRVVYTNEILDNRYVKNDKNRCYYCKSALFQACQHVADELNWTHIAYGFNLDDAGDFRPGQVAAEQQNILRPLFDCRMTKNEIRMRSKNHGLKDFDRPAQPCLASRLLYGTEVTTENLNVVETLEAQLQILGFKSCRARYDGTTIRIEVHLNDLSRITLNETRETLVTIAKTLDVKFITLDLEGFQTGKLNRVL